MSALRLRNSTPEELLQETIVPRLLRNKRRLPQQVLDVLPADALPIPQPEQKQ
jgi:hypothetical protein